MQNQRWRSICEVDVGSARGMVWVPALDFVTVGRLYRVQVVPQSPGQEQRWISEGSQPVGCTADGDPALNRIIGTLPMSEIAVGALIGRVGGSTADGSGDKERMFVFSVGRYCVFQAPDLPKAGALFFAGNESRAFVETFTGSLKVSLEQAL